jgi:RimJ/RimL family protein N-acetyltransferase
LNTTIERASTALHTPRLTIRTLRLEDAPACHQLYAEIGWGEPGLPADESLARRRSWLKWSIDSERELARLRQPPYGDRAVVDRESGAFIGLVGLVPSLVAIEQLPSFGGLPRARQRPEVGLFWAITPAFQRRGLASEAAAALVDHAFDSLAWPVSSPPPSTTTSPRSPSCGASA